MALLAPNQKFKFDIISSNLNRETEGLTRIMTILYLIQKVIGNVNPIDAQQARLVGIFMKIGTYFVYILFVYFVD